MESDDYQSESCQCYAMRINPLCAEKFIGTRICFYPTALRAGGVLSSRFGRAAAKLAEPISL